MDATHWTCICKQDMRGQSSYETVKCTHCGAEGHSNCYELYSVEAKKNFLCLRCRIEYNDPFHDLEETLLKPACFYSSETIKQETSLQLSSAIYSLVKEKKSHSVVAVLTKVIYEAPKYIEAPNTEISLLVNGTGVSFKPRTGIILDKFVYEGKNTIAIAINNLPAKCVIGIYMGKKVDVKAVAKRILKLESQPSIEEAKRNFESIRFRELEVLAAFPLKDPITQKMMFFAARGSKCRHLQCFDIINFLKFYQNPSEKQWQCVCCKNIIPWRDLRVDQYVYTILKEIREKYKGEELEDIENICFDEKGDWKIQQDFSKEWEQNFAMNREKRLKERKEKMDIEKEGMDEESKHQFPAIEKPKTELTLEECIESYNALSRQTNHLVNSEQINESLASKMKELNSFKNFSPYKTYDFFEKTMMLIGCALPGIFTNSDEKIQFYKLEDLAEMVYKKKLNSLLPLIFSWAKSYEDLIVLTLLIVTRNKRNDPDLALAIELLLSFSWFMETKKVSFEGLLKQNMYQLFGKLLNTLGERLQWKVQEYSTLMIIFKKYIPDLHVPSTIPKKFGEESEKIFTHLADFIVNMLKGISTNDLLTFLDYVYKPPYEDIVADEEKILKYVFYYFILIFRRHQPALSNEEVMSNFKKWDKHQKAVAILNSEAIRVNNIKEFL